MFSIRVAEVRDAAAIAHVHVHSWLTTYADIVPQTYLATLNEADGGALWQDWLTRDIRVFVPEEDGRVVAFAGGGPIREPLEDFDSELYTLYLLREVQGRGIGKALLNRVAQDLVQTGHRKMLAWVLEQNPAVRFYEKFGASTVTTKEIEIGGVPLPELAVGWPDLNLIP